jgi:hypothetical protein
MTFDRKADRTILRVGDESKFFDIAVAGKINKALSKNYSVTTLKKRYDILKRQDFTGKLIPDEQVKGVAPTSHDNNVVMIPVKIKHKNTEPPKPEAFLDELDEDRLKVHMHNLFAEFVAVAKEINASMKDIAQTERNRLEVEVNRSDIQKEQLAIQKAMYQKATEKK